MMCFKHLVPYALLLPMSSASPAFIFTFAILLFYTVRPCGYCLALISILFLSNSPSSPFISIPSVPTPSTSDPTLLTSPTRKTWLDLNNGYLLDPFIRAFSTNATTYPERYITRSPSSSSIPVKKTVPDGYVDFRYRGLGFVWDFGWRRTEEGMEWEMEDWVDTKKRYGVLEEIPAETPIRKILEEQEESRVDIIEEGERKWQWAHSMFRSIWQKKGNLLGDW